MIAGTFGGGGQSKSHGSPQGEEVRQAVSGKRQIACQSEQRKERRQLLDRSKDRGSEPGKKGTSDKKNETGEKGREEGVAGNGRPGI